MGPSLKFSRLKGRVNGGLSSDTGWVAPLITSGNYHEVLGEQLISYRNSSALSNLYHFYSLYSARKYVG